MAYAATSLLGLGTWALGDNPGAGSQTVSGSKGLNDNWLILDTAVGEGHNVDGSHKSGSIHGSNLDADVCDGTTVEYDSTNHNIRIKSGGVHTTNIEDGAVTTAKLDTAAVTDVELADDAVIAGKIAAGGVDATAKIADGIISEAKFTHDNQARKGFLQFTFDAFSSFAKFGGLACTSTMGPCFGRAGCITRVTIYSSGAAVSGEADAYATSGLRHFSATSRITMYNGDGGGVPAAIYIDGVNTLMSLACNTANEMVVVEVEFD